MVRVLFFCSAIPEYYIGESAMYRLTIFFKPRAFVLGADSAKRHFPMCERDSYETMSLMSNSITFTLGHRLSDSQLSYIRLGEDAGLIDAYSCVEWDA